jgi:NADPH-dependent 2,4-dienoyl-CoA reductase/sulfur reductase-like enzyme
VERFLGCITFAITPMGSALVAAMEKAKKAVVIGGGYVGLEVAASCATRGLQPEVRAHGAARHGSVVER